MTGSEVLNSLHRFPVRHCLKRTAAAVCRRSRAPVVADPVLRTSKLLSVDLNRFRQSQPPYRLSTPFLLRGSFPSSLFFD
ncbi:hypothetical protein RJT34_23557 [Clitoria ternatea]|uniref:Uncharacterized protein n=1 Tax=Clitoria ternatea TaxID=43366 RepID=A0AAN9IGP4_CLITE